MKSKEKHTFYWKNALLRAWIDRDFPKSWKKLIFLQKPLDFLESLWYNVSICAYAYLAESEVSEQSSAMLCTNVRS